jgi:hypothetical protein
LLVGRHLIEPCGKIDRSVDTCLLGGVVLGAEQVEVEMRMDFADARRVIAPAVVALRKERDRINGSCLQRFLLALFVESFSDAGNIGRGVEIEVDLAVAERMFGLMHG